MNYRGGSNQFILCVPANDNACVLRWADNSTSIQAFLVLDTTEFLFKSGPIWSPEFLWSRRPEFDESVDRVSDLAEDASAVRSEWPTAAAYEHEIKRSWGNSTTGLAVRELGLGAGLIGLSSLLGGFGNAIASMVNAAVSDVPAGGSNGNDADRTASMNSTATEPAEDAADVAQGPVTVVKATVAEISSGSGEATASAGTVPSEIVNGEGAHGAVVQASSSALVGVAASLSAGSSSSPALVSAPAGRVVWGGDGADILIGGAGNDVLFGGAGDDQLIGGEGDDVLDGGQGSDVMQGGAGNDTFVVDDAGDVVIEDDEQGADTVLVRTQSLSVFSLSDRPHVENLVVVDNGDFTGIGNELANIVVGGSGNDDLGGAAGDDMLVGGGGDDQLDGGSGSDTMAGGCGNDSYTVDDANDRCCRALGRWHRHRCYDPIRVYA